MIGFLSSLSLLSQQTTKISGKILNHFDSQIGLKILAFDTSNMREPDDYSNNQQPGIKAIVNADSTYLIEIQEITVPFTTCVLVFGSQLAELILSPGDSLHVDLDYWSFENNTSFSGDGALRNQYFRQNDAYFLENERHKSLYYLKGRNRIEKAKVYYQDQLNFLDKFEKIPLEDSAFYVWEQNRIKYIYYHNLIGGNYDRKTSDSLLVKEVRSIIADLDLNDQNALMTMGSYRYLIRSFPGFMNKPFGDTPYLSFGDEIALGQRYYKGIIKSYYLWNLVHTALLGTSDPLEKQFLSEYAKDHISDQKVADFLRAYQPKKKSSSSELRVIFSAVSQILIFLLGMGLLIFGLIRLSRYLNSKRRRKAPAWIVLGVLIVLVLITILLLIRNGSNDLSLWVWVFTMAAFIGIHSGWLIPRYVLTKRLLTYTLLTIVSIGVYYGLLYLIISDGFNWETLPQGMVLKFFLFSLIPILLGAFLIFYIVLLIRKNESFSYLFDVKVLNLEVLVHSILVFIVMLPVVVNLEEKLGVFHLMMELLVLLYFYSLTFVCFPQMLK